MDELRRLDDTSDSMDEPFGAPGDPFRWSRARSRVPPRRVSVSHLIWRLAPPVGAIIGACYAVAFIPADLTNGMAQAWWLELALLAGMGAVWGCLCALGAWGFHRISSWLSARYGTGSRETARVLVSVIAGSTVGGVAGFAWLSSTRRIGASVLLFVAIVTLVLGLAVIIGLWRQSRAPREQESL